MAYVCMSCYEVYNNFATKANYDGDRCPKMNCCGLIAEIDDDLVEVIIELNKRGYITKMCCQGHPRDLYINTFIAFYDEESFPTQTPKGFKRGTEHGEFVFTKLYSKKHTYFELQNMIFAAITELMAWVQELPPNEGVIKVKKMVEKLNANCDA